MVDTKEKAAKLFDFFHGCCFTITARSSIIVGLIRVHVRCPGIRSWGRGRSWGRSRGRGRGRGRGWLGFRLCHDWVGNCKQFISLLVDQVDGEHCRLVNGSIPLLRLEIVHPTLRASKTVPHFSAVLVGNVSVRVIVS